MPSIFRNFIGRWGYDDSQTMKRSIIRRSIVLWLIIVPVFVLNYTLQIAAGRILTIEAFGIFYLCYSALNVLFPPMSFIALYNSRRISEAYATSGISAARELYRSFFNNVLFYGGIFSLFLFLALLLYFLSIGDNRILVIALLVLANYTSYLMESIRIGLLSIQNFISMACLTVGYISFRTAFALALLVAFRTVAAAMFGFFLAPLPLILFFWNKLMGKTHPFSLRGFRPVRLTLTWLPFLLSSGGISIFLFLDLPIGYLTLGKTALGTYSATSILPKAMPALLAPVIHILFPIIVVDRSLKITTRTLKLSALKAFGLTLTGGFLFTLALYVLRGVLGHGDIISISGFQSDLLLPLSLAMATGCCLRVLVITQLARGRDRHPLLLYIFMLFFALFQILNPSDSNALAVHYAAFSGCSLAVYGALCLMTTKE